ALLGFRDLAPRVEAARRDGRITDEISDAGWFKEALRKAVNRPDDLRRFDAWSFGTLDDPLADLAWTEEGAGLPQQNPYRDVGRNDPCPCGSGKKFKKCCLDKVAAA
ncbi:SEC-C metal-binding domain-containing protein, partial [Methylobacterium hispanicum]